MNPRVPLPLRAVALLRAVNVGGRTVAMTRLVEIFESLGCTGVETFLASGNVVFDAPSARALETKRFETALSDALGYDVSVFVRGLADIAAIARYAPFAPRDEAKAAALNVAFVSTPLTHSDRARIVAFETDVDRFHVHGAEIYWLCRLKQSQSSFNNAVLERALGRRSTIRSMSTIRRLTAKYGL